MKKFIKNNIIGFILGAVIFSGITAVVALSIDSKDVSYDNTTSGAESTNVQDVVDELYERIGSGISDIEFVNIEPYRYLYDWTITMTYHFTEKPSYLLLPIVYFSNNCGYIYSLDLENNTVTKVVNYLGDNEYFKANISFTYNDSTNDLALTITVTAPSSNPYYYMNLIRIGGAGGTRVS